MCGDLSRGLFMAECQNTNNNYTQQLVIGACWVSVYTVLTLVEVFYKLVRLETGTYTQCCYYYFNCTYARLRK